VNKLWVRLSLSIGLVTLTGLLITLLLINWQVGLQFRRFVVDDLIGDDALSDALSEYYGRTGSWRGVERVFHSYGERPPNEAAWRLRKADPALVLINTNGQIIHSTAGPGPHRFSWRDREQTIPIEWQGQTVGHLLVGLPRNDDLSRAAIVFLQRVNVALLQAGLIAGGLGVLLGLIMARGLTAPLAQLSAAARRISQGKLNQQVAVKGPDEVAGLARAFNDMSAALEKGEQLRRNLVADVAHELRTPLSVIQGNLRAILDDVYTLDKEEVARLYEQTRHLSRLVNDLHELAQAEARQLPLNRQPVNLNDLVALTGETFAPVAETKGVSLEMILPAQTISLNVDSTRLRQVLHNLLNNALRHTPKGGRIMLNLEPNSEAINLSVSDTGEGIPPDHLPHIFNRFYRADAVRSRESGGTGLGLAIARAIVEAHNGQISAASSGAPGQGSTFTVTFPIDQAGR